MKNEAEKERKVKKNRMKEEDEEVILRVKPCIYAYWLSIEPALMQL